MSSRALAHYFPEHEASQALGCATRYMRGLALASRENGDDPFFNVVRAPVPAAVHFYLYCFGVLSHLLWL